MKDVQCYELFGGIALKNHALSLTVYSVIFSHGESVLMSVGSFNYCLRFVDGEVEKSSKKHKKKSKKKKKLLRTVSS